MRSGSSATGNKSFSNLVGTGSNKHDVGLDAVISSFYNFTFAFNIFFASMSFATCIIGMYGTQIEMFCVMFMMLIFHTKKFGPEFGPQFKFMNLFIENYKALFRAYSPSHLHLEILRKN